MQDLQDPDSLRLVLHKLFELWLPPAFMTSAMIEKAAEFAVSKAPPKHTGTYQLASGVRFNAVHYAQLISLPPLTLNQQQQQLVRPSPSGTSSWSITTTAASARANPKSPFLMNAACSALLEPATGLSPRRLVQPTYPSSGRGWSQKLVLCPHF